MVGHDDVSRFLASKGFEFHAEPSTKDTKAVWLWNGRFAVAVHTRRSDLRVEFADPHRALNHPGIHESGRQFAKNGGRNFVFRPESDAESREAVALAEAWVNRYARG